MIIAVDVRQDQVAELARHEACRYPARSPERRAAVALYVSLTTTTTLRGARAALAGFAAPDVQAAAIKLLHQLAAGLAATTTTGGTPS